MKKLYSILTIMFVAMSSIAYAQDQEAFTGEVASYPGYLNVSIYDAESDEWGPVAENESNTITITKYADGTCDFLLPNFALSAMELELGDILVEGATVTVDAAGVETYQGFVKDMPLLGGELIADVTLSGTITAKGVVDMKIDVLWMEIPIACTFTSREVGDGEVANYPGYLNVSIYDAESDEWGPVAENESNTITITKYADGTCDFLLPNFALSAMELELGDILVEGATVTVDAAGVETYKGFVKDMPLLGGELIADVTLSGTITAAGVVDMKIDVLWMEIPIACTFTSSEVGGIESIAQSQQGEAVYYNLQGVKVVNPENGVFVKVQGGKATKVVK